MAPGRAVTSSKSSFVGTSAAAPHVAGAVALYREATGAPSLDALNLVIEDAIPMGDGDPNNDYGHGRLHLDATRGGWACAAGESGPCTTSCGTEGVAACGPDCRFGECVPPDESCSGTDEDCDGLVDEGFPCSGLQQEVCVTECGSEGIRACQGEACSWGACAPPVEACTGVDDDCDGEVDEGAGCVAPDASGGCFGAPASPLRDFWVWLGILSPLLWTRRGLRFRGG